MTLIDLDTGSAVILSWLLTYAIHSTILLGVALIIALRFADEHAWLDLVWKAALLGPLVTASVQVGSGLIPLGGRWPIGIAAPMPAPMPVPTEDARALPPEPLMAATERASVRPSSPALHRDERAVQPASPPAISTGVWGKVAPMWPSVAVLSWLTIGAVMLARFAARVFRLHRALASGPAVSDHDLRQTVVALGAGDRAPIRLTTSETCAIPLALPGRRIVLPERFLQQLDAEHQRARAGARDRACDPARSRMADPGRNDRADILLPAAEPRRPREAVRLSRVFVRPVGRAADALAPCPRQVSLNRRVVGFAGERQDFGRSQHDGSRRLSDRSPRDADPQRGCASRAAPVGRLVGAAAGRRCDGSPARYSGSCLLVRRIGLVSPRRWKWRRTARLPGEQKQQDEPSAPRVWSASELAQARARLRVHRAPRPSDPLADRWRWALDDARRQGIGDFWIVYRFDTPTHAQDLMMSDTREGTIVSTSGRLITQGPPLADLLDDTGGAGNVTVLIHYGGARADAIDRGGYRSTRLGFDFGRTPVFWLGSAPEAQSFERVQELFGQARNEKIQELLIELASLHPTTDMVLPFLTRLVDPANPVAIRREAAEGFDHHHDPRSVEILMRVASTDTVSEVRAEAAETIGEVQTPQSIPALTDLATNSPDRAVRREAAEAFADQPPALALPAIEALIATSDDDEVLVEAVEALAEIEDPQVLPLLVRTATGHPNQTAQQEAVETLGDVESPDAVDALVRIVWGAQGRENPTRGRRDSRRPPRCSRRY